MYRDVQGVSWIPMLETRPESLALGPQQCHVFCLGQSTIEGAARDKVKLRCPVHDGYWIKH